MRKEARHYVKVRSSLRKPPVPEHLPPKPRSAYFTVLCSHLYLWLYGGLTPITSLGEGVNLQLQVNKNSWVWQECFNLRTSLKVILPACTGSSGHMWLFAASQPWEARDVLDLLKADSFGKLEIVSIVGWLGIILVKGFHLLVQYLLLSLHIPCPYTHKYN